MQFTMSAAAAILAMASSVLAQTAGFNPVFTPESGSVVPAGSVFEITWDAPAEYADGTISISLIGGATQNTQVPLADIAAGIPNSQESYSWTVGSSLGAEAVYGLILRYESDPSVFQYSMPFHIEGTSAFTSVAVSAQPTTVTASFGTMTVTLSSAHVSSTETPIVTSSVYSAVANCTTSTFSSTHTVIPSVSLNSTITSTHVGASTTFAVHTSTQVIGVPTPTGTAPTPTGTPESPVSGAAALGAPFALVGALVMAFFAL